MATNYGGMLTSYGANAAGRGHSALQALFDREERKRAMHESIAASRADQREAEYQNDKRQKHADTVAKERFWTQTGIGVGAGAIGGGIAGLAAAPAAAGASAAGAAGTAAAVPAATTAATTATSTAAPMALTAPASAGIGAGVSGGLSSLPAAVASPSAPVTAPNNISTLATANPYASTPSAGSRFATGAALGGLDSLAGTNHAGAYFGSLQRAPMDAMRYSNAAADLAHTGMRTGLIASQIATEDERRPGRVEGDWATVRMRDASAKASDARGGLSLAKTETEDLMRQPRIDTETKRGRAMGLLGDRRSQDIGYHEQIDPVNVDNAQKRGVNLDASTGANVARAKNYDASAAHTAKKTEQLGSGGGNVMPPEQAADAIDSVGTFAEQFRNEPTKLNAVIDDWIIKNRSKLSPGAYQDALEDFYRRLGYLPQDRRGAASVGNPMLNGT